jgi:hypothetical protein
MSGMGRKNGKKSGNSIKLGKQNKKNEKLNVKKISKLPRNSEDLFHSPIATSST